MYEILRREKLADKILLMEVKAERVANVIKATKRKYRGDGERYFRCAVDGSR